jgi:hypothetical protein
LIRQACGAILKSISGGKKYMTASKFFNNSGPVNQTDHFCVPPLKRLDSNKVWQLILQKKYFLIRGPKQSGKTSYLLALSKLLNQKGYAKCLYINVECLRGTEEDLKESMRSLLFEISSRARDHFGDDYLDDLVLGILEKRGPFQALNELLTQWSKRSEKPIVLLVDEIDTLQGTILTSFLSQIRAGNDKRPTLFPQSIIFCGTHDVIEKQFNIKDATLKISFMSRADLNEMIASYCSKRHVEIDSEAVEEIWEYSNGQPWIVSTLCAELFHEIVPVKGLKNVSAIQVSEAIDNVLAKKGNHIEYIASQLRNPRVKKCMIPMLTGGTIIQGIEESDLNYLEELGLLNIGRVIDISNKLYKEIIPRALFGPVLYMTNLDDLDYQKQDGAIDAMRLVQRFQVFFANHIQHLVTFLDYGEAGYSLVFQALLFKLVDANTQVSREFGLNSRYVVLRLHRREPTQEIVFFMKQGSANSMDHYKKMMEGFMEEADIYLSERLDFQGEFHLIGVNTEAGFDEEYKARYAKKQAGKATMHCWGF